MSPSINTAAQVALLDLDSSAMVADRERQGEISPLAYRRSGDRWTIDHDDVGGQLMMVAARQGTTKMEAPPQGLIME
jgi:hypothetical protein